MESTVPRCQSQLKSTTEMIDVNHNHNPEEKSADVTFSLEKVNSMRPGKRIMDEGYWTCIMMREPILNYDNKK